ncbi:hypothetical protein CMUS01_11368 [Colletotrichum musicola]|uniref:Zn(2)-C6 fungal-type domain-containing protein n=1 Tax=Colletotrichum musicola TaxID=2175873 RepID=A0A8H6JZ15_9PEZI|nr:hypothetical protein CMUS01_11368 [Colletotrichum musicola]
MDHEWLTELPSPSVPLQRQHTSACDQCHRRKLRCSRQKPACERFHFSSLQCTYSLSRPVGRPKRLAPSIAKSYLCSDDYDGPRNGEASCLSVDIQDFSPFSEDSAMPLISPESLIENYFVPEPSCGCTQMLLISASNLEAALGRRQQHTSNQFRRSTAVLKTANRTFELLIMCKNKHDGLHCLLLLAVLHQTDRCVTSGAATSTNTPVIATGSTPFTPITPQGLESVLAPASCQQPDLMGLLEKTLESTQRELITKIYLLLAAVASELLVEGGGFHSDSVELELLRNRVQQLKLKVKAKLSCGP